MPIDFPERALMIEKYILQVKGSVRLAWILSFAVFACGIICAVLINIYGISDDPKSINENMQKLIGTIGSGIITLFSALPLKDYFSQKAKINTFEFLKTRYEKLGENPKKTKDLELEELEKIFWKVVANFVGA